MCHVIDESWQARVCVGVFSTLMPRSNDNKRCWWELTGYYFSSTLIKNWASSKFEFLQLSSTRINSQPSLTAAKYSISATIFASIQMKNITEMQNITIVAMEVLIKYRINSLLRTDQFIHTGSWSIFQRMNWSVLSNELMRYFIDIL
jgi:hypothetical protein